MSLTSTTPVSRKKASSAASIVTAMSTPASIATVEDDGNVSDVESGDHDSTATPRYYYFERLFLKFQLLLFAF